MATSTIALCSSLTTHCKISHHHHHHQNQNQNPPSLSLLSLSKTSLSLSKPKFLSPLLSSRPTFPHTPKFSESEAAVIDIELDKPEPEVEPAQIVETSPKEEPKREEVFAVVMVGSRQYIVFPGRWIYTQRLKGANVNDKIVLNKVLLVGTKTTTYIGRPVVTNAAVHAVVEEQGLNPKVIVFKYKKKKNYRRNIGHRQPNTRIRITAITGYQDYPAVTLDSQSSLGKTSNTEGSP